MTLTWGDTQTTMGTLNYFKNITGINSGSKPADLHVEHSMFRIYIPNNVVMEDVNIDTFIGYRIGVTQFIIYQYQANWIEEEGNTQQYNITNIFLTTSRYEKGIRTFGETNSFALAPFRGTNRLLNAYVDNFTWENDYHYRYYCQFFFPGSYATIEVKNIYVKNSGGAIVYFSAKSITTENIIYKNITVGAQKVLNLLGKQHLSVKNIVFEDAVISASSSTLLFNFHFSIGQEALVEDITIRNLDITSGQSLINLKGNNANSYIINNIVFENVTMNDATLIGFQLMKNINISEISCSQVRSVGESVTKNALLRNFYSSTATSVNVSQYLNNIMIDDSSVSIISLTKSDYSTDLTQSFIMNNVTYK